MSYLCNDCGNNNNGWCTVRKCNGLKKMNISSCNTYDSKQINELQPRGKRAESNLLDESCDYEINEKNCEAHRVLGKRYILWNIQNQIVAINKNVKKEERYEALVNCIKGFLQMQDFEEQLYKVEEIIDSVMDSDIIEQSKRLNKLM